MGGLRPIGSEKLEGMDKIKRIMEIARYNENIPQSVNETKSTEYKISLADGNTYEIVKERQGYVIKKSINESEADYVEPMKNRKYFPSYSQALKRLNLITKEVNTLFENEEGTPLLGEQKKKFILKTNKQKNTTPSPEMDTPPMEDIGGDMPPPPAEDMNNDMPPPPTEDMGGDIPPPPVEDMGDDESMEDMGDDDFESDDDLEINSEPKKEKKISDIKRIQILVGKLSQKIRSYEEEKDLSPQNIKYIINSILSAINVDVLDENDIEDIIEKLEGDGKKRESEDEDMSSEEEFSDEDMSSEDEFYDEQEMSTEEEPEMSEGYDTLGDALRNYLPSAYGNVALRNMGGETTEDDVYETDLVDDYNKDRRKGRKHYQYPEVDSFSHGTFNESNVDKVLSKYFLLSEEDENNYNIKKQQKTEFLYKQNKDNIVRLSESSKQMDVALNFIKENPRVKLIGLSNKGNLVFKQGINEVKITKSGVII
jgi:hypothetical protein